MFLWSHLVLDRAIEGQGDAGARRMDGSCLQHSGRDSLALELRQKIEPPEISCKGAGS